jgi:hypothetical protein
VAIDIAMSVATARPWQGFPVEPGLALYVSAEGGTGIGKRVRAWLDYYAVLAGHANMAWLVEAMTVNSDSDDLDIVIDRLDTEMERWPTLIILDTLARCFDGDENQQQDMGRFIQGVDKLRMKFHATVIVVHHTRLDGARERGNTAFRGAADAMISVAKKDDEIVVTNNKQKDSEEFAPLRFHLQQNAEIDSCVLLAGAAGQRDSDHRVIQCLAQYGAAGYTDLWKRVQGAIPLSPISERTYKRTLVRLRENSKIIRENGFYALLPEAVGVVEGPLQK